MLKESNTAKRDWGSYYLLWDSNKIYTNQILNK